MALGFTVQATGFSTGQLRIAQRKLAALNADREARELPPFPNVPAIFEQHCLDLVAHWETEAARDVSDLDLIKRQWAISSDAQKADVSAYAASKLEQLPR